MDSEQCAPTLALFSGEIRVWGEPTVISRYVVNSSNMSKVLGTRKRNPPARYRAGTALESNGKFKSAGTKARGPAAARKRGREGGAEGNLSRTHGISKNGPKVNISEIEDSSDDDSVCEHVQELSEIEEEVAHNRETYEHMMGNCMVIFGAIFNLIPTTGVNQLESELSGNCPDDHKWLKTIVDKEVERRKNETRNRNNNDVEALSANSGAAADAEGTVAGPTMSIPPPPTSPTPMGAASITNIAVQDLSNIQQQKYIEKKIQEQFQARLDEQNRKKNIIISGMVEGHDDWILVGNMFRAMRLGHLIDSIQCDPTRLGAKARNGKFRTIRVTMRNEDEVKQIMRKKFDLFKTRDYCLVYINNDLSKTEREAEYNDRKNRRSRQFQNAANGAGVTGGGGNTAQGAGGSTNRTTGAGGGRGGNNAAIGTAQNNVLHNAGSMELPKPETADTEIEKMQPLTHEDLLGAMTTSTAAALTNERDARAPSIEPDIGASQATSTATAEVNKCDALATSNSNVAASNTGTENGSTQATGNAAENERGAVGTGADTGISQPSSNTAESPVGPGNEGIVGRLMSTPRRILGGLWATNDAAKVSKNEKREEDSQG